MKEVSVTGLGGSIGVGDAAEVAGAAGVGGTAGFGGLPGTQAWQASKVATKKATTFREGETMMGGNIGASLKHEPLERKLRSVFSRLRISRGSGNGHRDASQVVP